MSSDNQSLTLLYGGYTNGWSYTQLHLEEEQELDSGHTLPEVGELEAEMENVLPPIPIDIIFSRLGRGEGTEYS